VTITITNAEDCVGWPPLLPEHGLAPCTAQERLSPDTAALCASKGSCPAVSDAIGAHIATCEFACGPGYRVSGAQPSCSAATGTLTNPLVCEEIPGTLKATIPVAKDIASIPPGSYARLEFESEFSSGVAALLGIDASRVHVMNIVAADGRRRLQAGSGINVEFVILPATDASGVMAEEADPEVSTTLFQALSGPISIAPGISSPSGVVLSEESLTMALAAIGRNPLAVTASITLDCTIEQTEVATFRDTFKADVAALLANRTDDRPVTAEHIAIADISAGSVVVNFLVLPYDAGNGGAQVALHISALELALADGVLIGGYSASGLTHAGGMDAAIILPAKPGEPEEPNVGLGIGIGVGAAALLCLMLVLFVLVINNYRASSQIHADDLGKKDGKKKTGAVIGSSETPTAAEFETDSEGDEESAVRGIVGLPSQTGPSPSRLPPLPAGISPNPLLPAGGQQPDPFGGEPVPVMVRRTDASAKAAAAAESRGMLGP